MTPILGTIASSYLQITSSFYSIASTTIGAGGTSTITFSNIPQTYKHLQVRGFGVFSGTVGTGQFRFNSSSSTYSYHALNTDGTNKNSTANSSQSYGTWNGNAGTVSSTPVAWVMDIPEYTNTSKNKIAITYTGFTPAGYVELGTSVWQNTAAVTQIDFTNSASTFAQHCVVSLYGIKE